MKVNYWIKSNGHLVSRSTLRNLQAEYPPMAACEPSMTPDQSQLTQSPIARVRSFTRLTSDTISARG